MRQALSLALVLLMVTRLGPTAFGADNVTNRITGMATGTNIEVRFKDKHILRGAGGEVAGSGFTLLNRGAGDRQINFDEVTSVKQLDKKSHTRNVLIVAGVAVAVFALVVLVRVRAVQGLAGHYLAG
jgi:hypothetical protein